jgi:hypothetical protein
MLAEHRTAMCHSQVTSSLLRRPVAAAQHSAQAVAKTFYSASNDQLGLLERFKLNICHCRVFQMICGRSQKSMRTTRSVIATQQCWQFLLRPLTTT